MIGLEKRHKDLWDFFVLSCEQGKSASVQSKERRVAVLAVAEFVARYQVTPDYVYFAHEAELESLVLLGNCGLSLEQKKRGYVATICSQIQKTASNVPHASQDLHVTRKQLEDLKDAIERFLKNNDQSEEKVNTNS